MVANIYSTLQLYIGASHMFTPETSSLAYSKMGMDNALSIGIVSKMMFLHF